MASVKWLNRITATSTPYEGYWQTLEYAYWKRKNGLPTIKTVSAEELKQLANKYLQPENFYELVVV